ncbi:hypothetical protein Plhal304r1_c021g0074331 [Plasmopara halstedii]
MCIQPQHSQLHVKEQLTKSHIGKHSWHRHHNACTEMLPKEAQELKEKILRTHKTKLMRFSMTYMKKRVEPPVEIPDELNNQHALSTIVAGRRVPLTRCMWNNTKRRTHHMKQISESNSLRCTLYRSPLLLNTHQILY